MKNTCCVLMALGLMGLISQQVDAQQPFVETPKGPSDLRWYHAPTLPPAIVTNSQRLKSLIRADRIYLTLEDAIALAIENNLDLQVARYGPLEADWTLRRQQGGGPLRGVTGGNSLTNQAVSGQGVIGTVQSAGLSSGNGGGGSGSSGSGSIQQIGPVTPNLDTFFQNQTFWAHKTQPLPYTFAGVSADVEQNDVYNSFAQQGLLTGGIAQLSFNQSYLNESAAGDVLNPSDAPVLQIYARQNLLNSFGIGVNSRYIRVAQLNVGGARETFRQQLLTLVATVVNQYWDLVTDTQDLREKQEALEFAQKFYEDTNQEIRLGAVAKVDIYRAEAEVSTRQQDLALSRQSVEQQEISLKTSLSRDGLQDPLLENAHVVALDRLEVPATDDLPPLRDLVNRAMKNRPDMILAAINDQTQAISSAGTKNGILPFLQVSGTNKESAEAGVVNLQNGVPPPNSSGGFGTSVEQLFKRDYTSRSGTIAFQGYFGNHQAQADYGIDQLQLRQGDLVTQRNKNDVVVSISNQMIALRQARSRYQLAVSSRALQADLLEKEQQKFRLGSSTIDLVIAAQRTLSAAQSTEISALSQYSHSRVALDQVLGETLETNHVSMDEALKGTVGYESKIPASVPQ
jgi:outer membrane protein TolC